MRKALSYLTFINLLFLLLLGLSSFASGIFGKIIYYIAFLLPVLIALLLKDRLDTPSEFLPLRLSKSAAVSLIPLVAPTLALVFFVSWLTSILLSFIGEGSVTDVSGNIVVVILTHAVLTSLFEELLFRYVPLAYLSPISKRGAIWISALFFAFAHCDLYQIPYAFIAGVIFAAVDLIFDSIWPSVLIHFLNNLVSILWLRNAESPAFVTVYITVLVFAAMISLLAVLCKKNVYKEKVQRAFADKNKYTLSYEPILFFVTALVIAAFNL